MDILITSKEYSYKFPLNEQGIQVSCRQLKETLYPDITDDESEVPPFYKAIFDSERVAIFVFVFVDTKRKLQPA
jgi:hypothetical protein